VNVWPIKIQHVCKVSDNNKNRFVLCFFIDSRAHASESRLKNDYVGIQICTVTTTEFRQSLSVN
jgi:hypothetical protein